MENFFFFLYPSLLPTYRYLIVIENVDHFSISLEDSFSERQSYQKKEISQKNCYRSSTRKKEEVKVDKKNVRDLFSVDLLPISHHHSTYTPITQISCNESFFKLIWWNKTSNNTYTHTLRRCVVFFLNHLMCLILSLIFQNQKRH